MGGTCFCVMSHFTLCDDKFMHLNFQSRTSIIIILYSSIAVLNGRSECFTQRCFWVKVSSTQTAQSTCPDQICKCEGGLQYSILFALEVDGSNVSLTARCLLLSSPSGLIPLSAQTWINSTWNWVSHPGSRSVHMGHFHWPTAAMARGARHTNHWLVVTMKVQTHHEERLRWAKSVESSSYFSSATWGNGAFYR